jgi:hypothetical protein
VHKYDLKIIRHKARRLQLQDRREHWLEIRGRETLMESLAWELFWKIFDAYPDCRVDIGDSWDLALDNMYASGSCDFPDDSYPVHRAYVRLWVERKWGPLWIIFEEERVVLCKSLHDHPEVVFAKKSFCEVPYEYPRLFTLLEHVLAYFGWPVKFP